MENMNQIQVFTNNVFGDVRAINVEGKVWFVGRDAVKCLGYEVEGTTSYTYYIKKYINDEDILEKKHDFLKGMELNGVGRKGEVLINKHGVIQLVMKSEVVSESKKQEFLKWLGIESEAIVLFSRKENEFLDVLKEQLAIFGITKCNSQYSDLVCGNYKIDLYIPELNVAIEYDENGHQGYSYEAHELRQQLIEKELGCHFIRVSDDKSHVENSAIVLRELMKLNLLK